MERPAGRAPKSQGGGAERSRRWVSVGVGVSPVLAGAKGEGCSSCPKQAHARLKGPCLPRPPSSAPSHPTPSPFHSPSPLGLHLNTCIALVWSWPPRGLASLLSHRPPLMALCPALSLEGPGMSWTVQHAPGSRSPDGLLGMVLAWQWPVLQMRGWAWGLGHGGGGTVFEEAQWGSAGPQRPDDDAQVPHCSAKDGPAAPSSSVTDPGERQGPLTASSLQGTGAPGSAEDTEGAGCALLP